MKLITTTLLLLLSASFFAQVAINITDANGLKQGYWVKLNPENGRPAYKGTFKDNKPMGIFKYYYPEVDTMRSVMDFRNDGKVAYSSLYYMTGVIQAKGKYVDEKKDSTWNFYDDKGKLLSVEDYTAGKKNGKATIYFVNGVVSEEKTYKMDQLDGAYKEYFESKKIRRERNYVNGKQVGKEVVYFPNGIIELMGVYNKAGKMHGVWITNDKTGKQIIKAVYDNGKRLSGKKADEWIEKNKAGASSNPIDKSTTGTKPTTKGTTNTGGKTGSKK